MKSVPSLLVYGTVAAIIAALTSSADAAMVYYEDVDLTEPHQKAIYALTELGVVQGNPNGYFYPKNTVNRAEILKMLYEAASIEVSETAESCFTDVPARAWYTPYVCHAKEQGFIQGYNDGTFKPAQGVNTVEALKMLVTVFGLPIQTVSNSMPQYTDVIESEWYFPYVQTIFALGIAPIEGQDVRVFGPGYALQRAQVAAYIYNTLQQTAGSDDSSSASSLSSRPRSNVSTDVIPQPKIEQFPWEKAGKFKGTDSMAYEFTLTSARTLQFQIEQRTNANVAPRCSVYKLEEDGLAYEYYLGVRNEGVCTIIAKLAPGDYQVQFFPTIENAIYSATITPVTGDKNDGYSEAKALTSTVNTHTLQPYNTHNWYTFTLSEETSQTITVSNSDQVTCII